jgi:hypothetical protein
VSATLGQTAKKVLKQPAFLVTFVVLLIAAVSLNAATQFLKLHFKKQAVPLAHPLEDIHTTIGSWVCVSKDVLSEDVEQELGTHDYVMRYYIKRSAITPGELAEIEGLRDYKKQIDKLGQLRNKYQGKLDRNIISFAVTYYTGAADTVPHIPERCYTAGGFEPTDADSQTWDVKTPQIPTGKLPVRYISFDDQSATSGQLEKTRSKLNVAYFFHCNGGYTSESGAVRLKLQNLFVRYGYFAKIELMVKEPDRDAAAESIRDFLRSGLVDVENCMPDWNAVEAAAKAKS